MAWRFVRSVRNFENVSTTRIDLLCDHRARAVLDLDAHLALWDEVLQELGERFGFRTVCCETSTARRTCSSESSTWTRRRFGIA